MANGSEKYEADRGNNNEEASDSSKKVTKVATKGAVDYFTGGKGGAIVDKVADTKLGKEVINNLGKQIDRNPILKKAAEKLDEKGAVDAADQALSMMETGGADGAAAGGKGGGLPGGGSLPSLPGKSGGGLPETKSAPDLEGSSDLSGSADLEGDVDLGMDFSKSMGSFDLMGLVTGQTGLKVGLIAGGFLLLFAFSFIILVVTSTDSENENGSNSDGNGTASCAYTINGYTSSDKSIKSKQTYEVSNLKVRLMECDGSRPVAGEELVDFEKYILGVTAQENGGAPDEAIKVQAIAARSYSLARPAFMGNAGGTKLALENGQWILQLRACTYDHAYCDPDKGCWSNVAGGEGGATLHSGYDPSKPWSKGPVAQDSKIRTLVAETAGQILVGNNGYIFYTPYKQAEQLSWNSSANSGLKYKQILLKQYPAATDILTATCTRPTVTGAFSLWKQYGAPWSSINLGSSSKTIGSSGCLVTSVAMLIAKSGLPVNVNGEFNPGTFVKALNANNGFSGANFMWATAGVIAPGFTYQTQIDVSGLSKQGKLDKINGLLNSGYYVVAEVKGNTGQHWVAIDSVSGSTVNMMDPGSTATSMWDQYNWGNTSRLAYYKVS